MRRSGLSPNHRRMLVHATSPTLPHVRSVLFDVYGTLLRIPRPTRPYTQIIRLAETRKVAQSQIVSRILCEPTTLVRVAELLQVSLPAAEMRRLESELETELESIQLFPEAQAVLTSLRSRGFRLGVCSNLATPYVEPAKRLLSPLVDVAIWSCEVGFAKPSREIYEIAARKLGLAKSDILMVGDTHLADVVGAEAAGLNAQLLDRRQDSGLHVATWPTLDPLLTAQLRS